VASWGSFIVGLLTPVGGGVAWLIRSTWRIHKRLDSIEELAADAYAEAGLARAMVERQREQQRRYDHER
jgi:hypothetical protein